MNQTTHFISYKISKSGPKVIFYSEGFPYSYEEQMLLGAHSLMWGGQGERYVEGLVGPLPSPLNQKESVILYGKVVDDDITEDHDYGFNYLVIVVILPLELKDIILNNQILTILFSSYLSDIRRIQDFTREHFLTLVKFLRPYFEAQISIFNADRAFYEVIHLAFDVFLTPMALLDHDLAVIQLNTAFISLGYDLEKFLNLIVQSEIDGTQKTLYDFLVEDGLDLNKKRHPETKRTITHYKINSPDATFNYNTIRVYELYNHSKHYGFLLEVINQ